MNGRVTRVLDLSEADVTAWRALSEVAVEVNPIFEPECIVPAARLLPNGSGIHLVIAEEDGEFFGCFPIEKSRGGRDRSPLTLLERTFISATTMVRRTRYDLTPLLSSERSVEAMRVLVHAVQNCDIPQRPKFLRFEAMNASGGVNTSLREVAAEMHVYLYNMITWTRPAVSRRLDGVYDDSVHGKRKNDRKLLQSRRRLGERLGGEVHLVDRSDDPSAVDELFRLERSGYKFATGVALESWPGEVEWFRAVCDGFRRDHRLVVCTLEVGDVVVAIIIMFKGGQRLLEIHQAYDEEFKQFSPGVQLYLELFRFFHDSTDALLIDSCAGAFSEKSARLFPDSRQAVTVIAAIGGRSYGVLLRTYGFARDTFFSVARPISRRYPKLVRRVNRMIAKATSPSMLKKSEQAVVLDSAE